MRKYKYLLTLILSTFFLRLHFAEGAQIDREGIKFYGCYKGEPNVVYRIDDRFVAVPVGEELRQVAKEAEDPEGFLDPYLMAKSAKWQPAIMEQRQTVKELHAGASEQIVFEGISLASIIEEYVAKRQWPMELKIVVETAYDGKRSRMERSLKIPVPPY